jgi:hypothetical protein
MTSTKCRGRESENGVCEVEGEGGERERERVVREATNGAVTYILERRVVTTDK